jgi:carboxypeptidase family protein
MKTGSLVLLVAALDLGFLLAQPPSQGATITGQVVDARTHQPLRGAIVSAARIPIASPDPPRPSIGFRTGPDGRFVLRGVAPGIVNFVVSKAGYAPGPYASARPAADAEQIDNVLLTVPPGASLSGRIVDEAGQPVAGMMVIVLSAPSITPATLRSVGELSLIGGRGITDDDGRYWIGGLTSGEYMATVGTGIDQAYITSSGIKGVILGGGGSDPLPDAMAAKVALTTGEDRTAVDFVIRFRDRYTGPRPLDEGSATIAGRVVDLRGAAFPHAPVVLSESGRSGRMVRTRADAAGRFLFQNVPPGSVIVGSSETFARPQGMLGNPITLHVTAGARTENVTVTAERGGTISGTLTDEYGDPALATVMILTPTKPSQSDDSGSFVTRPDGTRIFGRAGNSDAKGRFRLGGVPAGEYVLSILWSDPITARTEIHYTDHTGQDRLVTPGSLFYPGVGTVSQASTIVVSEGSESTGIDMMIPPVEIAAINVTVTASRPIGEIQLHQILLDDRLPMLEKTLKLTESSVKLDARAGRYRLLASAEVTSNADNVVRLWSSVDVDADPLLPATATMVLEPGSNISGRIVFEGKAANAHNTLAWLLPVAAMPGIRIPTLDGNTTMTAATGEFSIEGILPGRYVIQACGSTSDTLCMLKAAIVRGRDVLDEPIDLAPGEEIGDVRLIVTDRISELSGRVTDATGKPSQTDWVVVFSADKKYWWRGSRRVWLVRPNADGQYSVRALAAGTYVVAAIPNPRSEDELLTKLPGLVSAGPRVTIAEGDRKVQDLRVR